MIRNSYSNGVPILAYLIIAVAAYLIGSLPTGYLVARAKGIDIRTVGSGNIGATNAFRILGTPAGFLVLIVDALKGYAACAWLCDLMRNYVAVPVEQLPTLRIVAGICVVLGHNYTCWLRFKGGKGIATTGGVYIALAPLAAGIALATWAIVFFISRYVSVASIAAAVALPLAVWLTNESLLLGLVTTALGLMAILKHRGNIKRLAAGTENRVNFRKQRANA